MSDALIELQYQVTFDRAFIFGIENRLLGGVRQSMQQVVDKLVGNIKSQFTDAALADTVQGTVDGSGFGLAADDYAVTGRVFSTWADMIWFEQGRPPGGKMPPVKKIAGWAVRKGIEPDPVRTQRAFAFAINVIRLRKEKHAVPVDALVEWMNKANVQPSAEFAINSMAYAFAKKIQRDGVPGHHYFQQGLEMTKPDIHASFEHVVVSTRGV